MKKTIFILILFMNIIVVKAQTTTFDKYISGFGSFEITDILEHNQQYYLLCNQSYDTYDQHSSFLLKLNKEGDSVTYYGIDISFDYVLRAFTKSLNGGLCFVGGIDSLQSDFNLSRDGLFIESDFQANIENIKTYRMPVKNELNNILLDDTCYYATGNKYPTANNMDIQVLKINSNGNLFDSVSLEFRSVDAVTSLSNADDNFLISGTILGGYNDGYLSMLTKDLDTLFFKKYNWKYDLNNRVIALWYSYSSKYTSNNTILFPSGFFVRNPIDTNDLTMFEHSGLIRTDKNGNLKSWHVYYLNCKYDRPIDVFETGDGNYIIAGTIDFANRRPIQQNLNGDFYLMKVDTLGNILWFKQYGDANYQEMKSAIQTSDGGFLLSGYSITNYPNQERTGYVVKTDSIGNVLQGFNQIENNLTKIYPNPAFDKISVQSNTSYDHYYILNLYGQKILEGELQTKEINISELPKGLFILKLASDKEYVQVKFIKE